jgi:hypothetical protein
MILALLTLGILFIVAVVATVLSVVRDGYGSRRHALPPVKDWSDSIR